MSIPKAGQNYVSRSTALTVAALMAGNDNQEPLAHAANGGFPWFHPAASRLVLDNHGSAGSPGLTVVSQLEPKISSERSPCGSPTKKALAE